MAKYVSLVKQRLGSLEAWKLEHIPRDCNEKADTLAAITASLSMTEKLFMPIYYQSDSSIITTRVSQVDEVSPSWMDLIVQYINMRELLNESAIFSLVNGKLFKLSLDGPYLKCLTTEHGQYVLAELHEGILANMRSDVADYL